MVIIFLIYQESIVCYIDDTINNCIELISQYFI